MQSLFYRNDHPFNKKTNPHRTQPVVSLLKIPYISDAYIWTLYHKEEKIKWEHLTNVSKFLNISHHFRCYSILLNVWWRDYLFQIFVWFGVLLVFLFVLIPCMWLKISAHFFLCPIHCKNNFNFTSKISHATLMRRYMGFLVLPRLLKKTWEEKDKGSVMQKQTLLKMKAETGVQCSICFSPLVELTQPLLLVPQGLDEFYFAVFRVILWELLNSIGLHWK